MNGEVGQTHWVVRGRSYRLIYLFRAKHLIPICRRIARNGRVRRLDGKSKELHPTWTSLLLPRLQRAIED